MVEAGRRKPTAAGNSSSEHGFTRVDAEERPQAWVECLDAMHREPFYREYKARVRAILAPRPTGTYLEVGSGVGTDALKLGATVIGVDRSRTMARESHARGLLTSIVAEAGRLPVASGRVDGCWADRTFQHLADPERALEELVRVARAGAAIVVVDPDYGTQVIEFPDPPLAQKVLDFRAHHGIRNGTLAHQMGQRFCEAGLVDVSSEEHVLTVRDPTSVVHVMGLRSWARAALNRGLMRLAEVDRWEAAYDQVVAEGRFHWSVSFFLTTGRKPGV